MIRAWYKNTVTPEEYYIFGYRDLLQKERDRFVSRKEKDLLMCLLNMKSPYLLHLVWKQSLQLLMWMSQLHWKSQKRLFQRLTSH